MICDNVMERSRTMAEEDAQCDRQKRLETLKEFQSLLHRCETHDDGLLCFPEFQEAMEDEHSPLNFLVQDLDLPYGTTPLELFTLLDENCDHAIAHTEMLQSFH